MRVKESVMVRTRVRCMYLSLYINQCVAELCNTSVHVCVCIYIYIYMCVQDLREQMKECYRVHGVNHLEECKGVVKDYLEALKVCFAHIHARKKKIKPPSAGSLHVCVCV